MPTSPSLLRFDLYRDSLPPGASGAGTYIGLWQHKLAFVDLFAWTGLFLGPFGASFQLLEFDNGSSLFRAPAALTVQFNVTGSSVTVRNELGPAQIRNILVDTMPDALRIEGLFDVYVPAVASADGVGRQITVVRAAQGRFELGEGNDRLVFEAFAQRSPNGFTITVDAGGGDDEVIITPAAGLWREQWFTVNATLGDGNDRFVGMGSNDTVFGGAGDDWAQLQGGTNFFDGGPGYNTIAFRGVKATYRIDDLGHGRFRVWDNDRTADGDDGITTFRNVQRVVFKDQVWEIAPPGSYNNPPVARDDGVFAISGVRVFTFAELLADDSDPEGQPLTVLAVSSAVGGTAVRNWQNNTVVFTPNAGFTGEARFTYTASDRNGGLADAVVRMVVGGPANRPPVVVDDAFAGTEDTPLAGSVALNDGDPDGDPLTYSLVGPAPAGLVLYADGTFTYTPPANLNGQVVFSYQVSDGRGGTASATATISLAPVEDAPISLDDAASTPFETPVIIPVLANDVDVDGQPLSVILWSAPASGSAVVNADNTITFTPGAGFSGEATFTYRAFDGVGFGNTAQVVVTVGPPPNRPPVADDVFFAIDEDTPFIANLFAFTSDPDLNQASIQILATTNLTITRFDGGTGEIEVLPFQDFNGIASISYQVTDAGGLSDTGVVTLTVLPVDDPPVGVPDRATTVAGTMVVIDVLANDYDVDGDALRALVNEFGLPANGFTIFFPGLPGGPIHYYPNPGFVGTDTFTYMPFTRRPDDEVVFGNVTTVTVTVVAANTAPVANPDTFSVQEGRTLTVGAPGLLANDTDADGDPISAALYDAVSAQGGVVTMVTDGRFTYTPPAGFSGTDTFTYVISDGIGLSAAATVTITVIEGTPVAVADAFTVRANQTLTVDAPGLLANDSDPNGDAISAALYDAVSAQGGVVTMVTDGSFTYTPPAGFVGTDSFTYVISDGVLLSAAATVTISVTNTAPVANPDTFSVQEGRTLTVGAPGLLANDTDADGDPISAALYDAVSAQGGVVTMVTDGRFTYTPPAGFSGTDTFTYVISDGIGLSAAATVTITVIEGTPVAVADAFTVRANQTLTVDAPGLLANDSDPNGDAISAALYDAVSAQGGVVTMVTDGSFTYTPPAGFVGTDSFTYVISDGVLLSAAATVTISVTNTAPVATDGGTATLEDLAVGFDLDATDAENNITGFSILSVTGGSVTTFTPATGQGIFMPAPNFNGTAVIVFRVTDSGGLSDDGTFTIGVLAQNDPPVGVNDAATTPFGTPVAIDVLANDFDVDGDALTADAFAGLVGGTVSLLANGTVLFTPAAGFSGVGGFTYRPSDGQVQGNVTSVTVTVGGPPNAPPVANNDAFSGPEDNWLFGNVLANDTDADGNQLTAQLLAGPANGSLSLGSNGSFTYVPSRDFFGNDSFTYRAFDGIAFSNVATVTLTITPVNDAPRDGTPVPGYAASSYGTDGIFAGTEETPITIAKATLMADDIDPEGDAISWWNAYGFNGNAIDNGDSITFVPFANAAGEIFGFYYYVRDAFGAISQPIYVVFNLANTPDPIDAIDDVVARQPGPTQTIAAAVMLANDVDPDTPFGDTKDITSVVAGNGIAGITLNPDDSVTVTYAPDGTYSGRAFYDYTVVDSTGNSDTARVLLNRPPVAADDGVFTLDEGDNYVFIPYSALLANDPDADGDPLSVVPWNWGYPGSNVYPSTGWFENGQSGLRVYLSESTYTGPAEFQYRAWDGHSYSNVATVRLVSVAGNDAPVANPDYWYLNGAGFADEDPATNDMVGFEDGTITFPVSRLIDGQFHAGSGPYGRDTDEEGDALAIVPGSLFSPYGTVTLVGGNIVFTPNADVNSGWPGGGLDWTRIWIGYRVTDGARESGPGRAHVLVLPTDDPVDAVDDTFVVAGSGTVWLEIGSQFGPYSVRANDSIPDNYPFGTFGAGGISDVYAVSGIADLLWDGWSVRLTPDGSGDPMVFAYVLRDEDGDTDTALVTVLRSGLSGQKFYFSGEVPDFGRELWLYDPQSFDAGLGSAFATMVDEAETFAGPASGDPREITALGDSVFWRADDGFWHFYRPDLGHSTLGAAGFEGFDDTQPRQQQNLGVRAGDFFWATSLGELFAFDANGSQIASGLWLPGYGRTLLTDAGHDPAFAAVVPTYDPGSSGFIGTEQLFVVLWDPAAQTYSTLQATFGAGSAHDIRAIAGLQVVREPGFSSDWVKTLFFAGDHTDIFGSFHADALWQVDLRNTGAGWSPIDAPRLVDLNGTGGAVPLAPYALTVARVTDGHASAPETLFLFGNDDTGAGRIFAYRFDHFGSFASWTSSDLAGSALTGLAIAPWTNGVVFSALGDDGAGGSQGVVASWTDDNGDGFYDLSILFGMSGGTIEHLVVDALAGHIAFVFDEGDYDTLYVWNGGTLDYVVQKLGDIDEVQIGGGHVVYRMEGGSGLPTLFDYSIQTYAGLEIPTDENTGGDIYSFPTSYRNVAIPGALVFEAYLADPIFGLRIFVTDGTNVVYPADGLYATSEGAVLNGAWVGTGYRSDLAQHGLFSIAADGSVATLYASPWNTASEAEVLGDRILFGTTSGAVNQILLHDAGLGTTSVLLDNHLLGAAAVVGSRIVFNAFDFDRAENNDPDPDNNVWDLWSYSHSEGARFLAGLPTGGGGGQPVYEWWRHQDFLGDDSRIYWKQISDAVGIEVHTIDLTAAVPASTLSVLETAAGPLLSGGDGRDAVFAQGRLYWQAMTDGTANTLRLWTTADGVNFLPVTGPELAGGGGPSDPGYQYPYLPVAIGNEVFFLAAKQAGFGWGVFQVNDDGITASLITPASFASAHGLAALGADLYFVARDTVNNTDQVWRITPGAAPSVATPQQLTNLPAINGAGDMHDLFLGGDGNVYFGRLEPGIGRELWVLDGTDPRGARMVIDLNQGIGGGSYGGYAPEQLVAVPDPLEAWLAGSFRDIMGSGG